MKKIITSLKNIVVISVLLKAMACNIAAGSYPYAEVYELDYSEEQVKIAINDFKEEYNDYLVPRVTIKNQDAGYLTDKPIGNPSHWHGLYFYYKDENKIIHAWTRSIGKNKTKFGFVGINEGLDLGNWKLINKDFSRSENKAEKKKFEERILNKIKEKL